MTAIGFPKMFSANQTNITSGKKASFQNFSLLAKAKLGEFFGDPEYGSTLVASLYQFNNVVLTNIVRDQVYTLIANYMPQWSVAREDIIITRTKTGLAVSFSVYDYSDRTTDMFNLDLTL